MGRDPRPDAETLSSTSLEKQKKLTLSIPDHALQPHTAYNTILNKTRPGRVAQSIGHLTRKPGVLGSIPDLATYFRFSFRFFRKGSCQLLAKVCARSTGLPLRRSKPAQEKCG